MKKYCNAALLAIALLTLLLTGCGFTAPTGTDSVPETSDTSANAPVLTSSASTAAADTNADTDYTVREPSYTVVCNGWSEVRRTGSVYTYNLLPNGRTSEFVIPDRDYIYSEFSDKRILLFDKNKNLSYNDLTSEKPYFTFWLTEAQKFNKLTIYTAYNVSYSLILDENNRYVNFSLYGVYTPVDTGATLMLLHDIGEKRYYLCDYDTTLQINSETYSTDYRIRSDGTLLMKNFHSDTFDVFDGKKIVSRYYFNELFMYTQNHLLVNENGNLRLYDTDMKLLADYGNIGSGNYSFDAESSSESADSGKFIFKYNPTGGTVTLEYPVKTSEIAADAELLCENSSFKFFRQSDGYYAELLYNDSIKRIPLPDCDFIDVHICRDYYISMLDSDLNNYVVYPTSTGINSQSVKCTPYTEMSGGSFGDYRYINLYEPTGYSYLIDRSNKVVLSDYGSYDAHGELLICNYDIQDAGYTVYNSSLEKLGNDNLRDLIYHEDGGITVIPQTADCFRIYSAEGKLVSESRKYKQVLMLLPDNAVLVSDKADGGGYELQLINTNGNLITTFCKCESGMTLNRSGSGYYDENMELGKTIGAGYYFIIDKMDGNYIQEYRYHYFPKTNETGKQTFEYKGGYALTTPIAN